MKKIVVLSAALFILATSVNARTIKFTGKSGIIAEKKTSTNLKMTKRVGSEVSATRSNLQYGTSVYASLPVSESYVTADVIAELTKKYGTQLYDITVVKADNNQAGYLIRLMQDGGQFIFQKVTDL